MIPFKIDFENGTDQQKKMVLESLNRAHKIMDSDLFKNAVLNFTQPDGKKEFYQARMTNEQVYEWLLKTPWNYSVSFYSKVFTSANAYVNPGDPTVNLNWFKVKGFKYSSLANTLVHENTHLKGFTHDYDRTPKRPYSVPYAIGKIIEDLINVQS